MSVQPTSWLPFWIALATNLLIVGISISQNHSFERDPPIAVHSHVYSLWLIPAQAVVQLAFALILVPRKWAIPTAVVILVPLLGFYLISFFMFFMPALLAVAYAFGKRGKDR